ncbi:MAG: hypothetical protein EKK68_00620 [Candidatus Competibacteraceae bacterium]|nr:MAG: hypothetical protein EKK68_00620 [Candidatus Competibacteraceae bacterium]
MGGYGFTYAVRANSAYSHLRLTAVATELALDQITEALAAGGDEYIMEPFTRDAVLDKLNLPGIR